MLSVISNRRKRYNIPDKWIIPLDVNVWHEMDGFRVILVDANHAPGAVMFIIEGDHRSALGRILYTGFFRADARFYQNVIGLSILQEVHCIHYISDRFDPCITFKIFDSWH